MGKEKFINILERAIRRENWSKIWDSRVIELINWNTFDFVGFNVILGSFSALSIFSEKAIFKRYYFHIYVSFQTKLFISILCNSPYKCYLL